MIILVANIGSTSFKFRLFDLSSGGGADARAERELASGGVERIGGEGGAMSFAPAGRGKLSRLCRCADHGQAIQACLAAMIEAGVLTDSSALAAVAFKAVMAGECEPVAFVDEKLLAAMEYYYPAAPAHNPAYVAAMRSFRSALGGVKLVAAFEPGFHRTIPPHRRCYAAPPEWQEKLGIRRYGYHGASHRYIAERTSQLMGGRARRIISCHLGGSSSICAVRDGASVATSMGFSPQTGLPQSKRVGEFDPYALALVARETGKSLEQMLEELGSQAGLAGMSGTSGDLRDILAAAAAGNGRAALALEAFVTSARDYIGAYLVELVGADALVFTGGMGEHSPLLRSKICRELGFAGIVLDEKKNVLVEGESRIESAASSAAIWVMPTNEELIVARQAKELLQRT
jgi:acetate kinase